MASPSRSSRRFDQGGVEEEQSAAWADQAAHKLLLLAFGGQIGHKQGVVARGPCARGVLPVLLAPGEG